MTLKPKTKRDQRLVADNARRASRFLKALSHEGRLIILCLLAGGEKSVGELEQVLALRQPAVSQQLARLRSDGLVTTRRNGKTIYYRLSGTEALPILSAVYKTFCGATLKRGARR
ncbi:MAG: Transcriptional regulator, ArsR family [Pseudolabrys sp.]|nr:Transcriptional regulator, ArsR family [Pseudolabrys sp.]